MAAIDDASAFKNSFKYFKQKSGVDLSQIINFSQENNLTDERISPFKINDSGCCKLSGLLPESQWNAYSIKNRPGLVLIRNPFTASGQRYWISRCFKSFVRKPNKRNIDIDSDLKDVDDIWEHCHKYDLKQLDKLRWATLGYHHNWNTKIYNEDYKSDFPEDLAQLGKHFATVLGYPTFEAQSAIVNFYHPNSTLSGHVDSSEIDLNAPLLSFSFGQSAIFLIGGRTTETEGLPLILSSGDVLLMSQEARLCYHAVPRIFSTDLKPWSEKTQPENWQYENYVQRSRINMNIRQVLPAGQTSLYESNAN